MDIIDSFILAATAPTGEASGTLGGLLLFITIAIAFSFLCSMLEAGLLSTPSTYIETKAQDGNRAGRWMQMAKENVDEPITAILTLNTFAHTVGAAGAGAQAVGVFGSQWAAVITFVLTLLILIFSEIIPKTVGAVYWKQLFTFNAYTIRFLVLGLYPAVWAFKAMTRLITPEEKLPTITRAEIEMMAHISAEEGSLNENENRILKNLLHLDKVQVGDIMTPRTVVLAFQQDMTVGQVLETSKQRMLPYSRIPVYGENIDDITGFILRYDVLKYAAADRHDMRLKDFLRPIHAVPETLVLTKAMDVLMQNQQHILLVIDEYGGTAGVITLEDVMESLLGAEITDESDLVEDLRKLAQQRYERQQTILAATELKPTANGARPTQEVDSHQPASQSTQPIEHEQPEPIPVDNEADT
ncbi:MAG: hemolysin [Phototrophicales bacterium]|nr:MAG: hemolysin [Phototrophicales bacterium]RMG70231.1 MAG: HlyC/CorC family transporter [Chloroflexota bacterium]